ncbi:MAG: MYG1 family protein [Candidatus Lloydbacteria bacterium]|nr:MYG1 family protein [Candidatus Lloydbacteria bacterium]
MASPVRIVTHNGHFHADDVFAVALLSTLLERKGVAFVIIRSRYPKEWEAGDFVVDVGDVYDAQKNRFDHHQEGEAGKHENGVPYSSLGLVWKKFGAEFSGSQEVADTVEKKLVEYIDAMDNGMDSVQPKFEGVAMYGIGEVIESFSLGWDEARDFDEAFMEALEVAKKILMREVSRAKSATRSAGKVKEAYEGAPDKRLIILDRYYPSRDILQKHPEPLYIIYPASAADGDWHVRAVRKEGTVFDNRKDFPKEWAGKRDGEFAAISGVPDAKFCHNGLWLAGSRSKEGAIALAKKELKV